MATQQELLQFKIEALGDEQLTDLARKLVEVGAAGGDAAPKANALLTEIAALADQAQRASGLAGLKAQLQETGDALFFAKQKAAELQAQFNAAEAPSAALTRQLDRANTTVTALDSKYNSLTASITSNENALRAQGVNLELLDTEQRRLQTSLDGTRTKATQLTSAFAQNSTAAKEEAVSIETLSQKYGAFGKIVESVKTLIATFAGLFALQKAKEEIGEILATGDKFAKFGDDFGDLFGGAEKGADALERVKQIAEQTPLSLDAVAAAALKAKKEGLDPFDGTLQALIDANAKFGGGEEILTDLIDKLGKAYNKGALSGKELVALQQAGIPVTQLLADALGKTTDEIDEMAKKGELGRESIRLLIEQIGKSASGNAADEMNTLSALTTKVKDEWEEFLKLISESGAYDFVRDKLKSINEAFKQGLADGTLKEKAKAISDAIVAIGNGAAAAAKFIYDHAAAIAEAAKGYIFFRSTLLALDLAGAAAKMLTLATATRTAGAAAAEAAAETGAFGKLRTIIGKIPTGIQIAVATVGLEFALSKTIAFFEASKDLYDVNLRIKELDQERANDLTVLASKAETLAHTLSGFARTQIADADQLATKNRSQSEEYIAALENATRYYTALQIQAQSIGDTDGAATAAEHLRVLAVALDEARVHSSKLAEDLKHTDDAVNTVVNRFDDLKTKGESAAVAVKGAFDHLELQTPKGLNDAIQIVQQLSIRSRDAKEAVETELGGALSKLNDADLRLFQQNVTQRLKDAKGDADALKVSLGSALQEELLRLGVSAEQAGAKFTANGQKIIATFASIATNAEASSQQIQLAFAQALNQAQTTGEVNALKARLQGAFDAGRISAAQFQTGVEAAGRKLADVQVAAATAGAELDGMGKEGETAAQRISLALQDARDKLIVQANQIATAINAALAAGDTAGADALRAQFKSLDAQIQDLNAHIQGLTPSYSAAAAAGEDSWRRQAEAVDDAGDAIKKAGDDAERFAGDGAAGLAELAGYAGNVRAGFLAISDAAAKAFDTHELADFNVEVDSTSIGFTKFINAVKDAQAQVTETITNQRHALSDLIDSTNRIGTESVQDFNKLGVSVRDLTENELSNMVASIKAGTYDAGLLGSEELQPLQTALEAAKQRVIALAAAATDAKQRLADMAREAHDALLQAQGDDRALEEERHQQKIADLQAEAQASGDLNDRNYQQALADENALHNINLQNLAAQQKAAEQQKQQAASGGGSSGGSGGGTNIKTSNPTTSSGGTNFQSGSGLPAGITHQVTINVEGQTANTYTDQQGAQVLLRALQNGRNNSI